jgi:DnaJ like chaperone protein
MSLWHEVGEAAKGGAVFGDWISWLFARIRDPETRRKVAFSVALIALSAKMAKADGIVTADEVAAFRSIFSVPAAEERNVSRLFNLAKRDVAGFESYASRVAALYHDDRAGLEDVIDGLFFIAKADGAVHEAELVYLEDVAAIFGFRGADFERIAVRHVIPEEGDPYLVLGASRAWPLSEIRGLYRRLVAENHPDRVIARGLPAEFVAIANDRMAAINAAWARIELERSTA